MPRPRHRNKKETYYGSAQQEQGQTFPYVESGLLLPRSASFHICGHHYRGDGICGRIRLRRSCRYGTVRKHESAVQRHGALRRLGSGRRLASDRHRTHHPRQDGQEQAGAHNAGGHSDARCHACPRRGDGSRAPRHARQDRGRRARRGDYRELRGRERSFLYAYERKLDGGRQV